MARQFDLPTSGGFAAAITAGDDGAMWFALNQGNAIGRVTTAGDITVVSLPIERTAPVGIASGPDGAIWYVGIGMSVVGRVAPDRSITDFALADGARPHAICAGLDGDLWFTEWGGNRVGHITTAGEMSTIVLPTPNSEPHGIAVAADGRVWVALEIGRVAVIEP